MKRIITFSKCGGFLWVWTWLFLNAEMSYIVSLKCNSYKAGQDFAPTTTPNSDVAWSRKKPGDFEPLEVTKDKI